MDFNSEKADRREQLVKSYLGKSMQELQTIQPKWAYGKDIGMLLDHTLGPSHNEYEIFLVKIPELVKNAEMYEVNLDILYTGKGVNDNRIATILSRWNNSQFVDPPSIYVCNDNENKVAFSDGRHRTKLAYLLGTEQILVAVDKSQVDAISKIIRLIVP